MNKIVFLQYCKLMFLTKCTIPEHDRRWNARTVKMRATPQAREKSQSQKRYESQLTFVRSFDIDINNTQRFQLGNTTILT